MEDKKTYKVPETELFMVPVPEETRTYKPVAHKTLAKITLDAIKDAGLKLASQHYSSAREGKVANARYTLADIKDYEMQLEIGWQNSYDKTLSLKFAIGTRIFICDNGCVSGDLGAFKHKHAGDIAVITPETIVEYIKNARETFITIQAQREAMKKVEMTKRLQAELIGRMFIEEGIISSSQMTTIRDEIKSPSFDYGAPESLWELYQHTTLAMKDAHPFSWMNNHIKAHDFFMNAIPDSKEEAHDDDDDVDFKPEETPFHLRYVDPAQLSLEDSIKEMEIE